MAMANLRRIVAIKFGIWRSVRSGGAMGSVTLGKSIWLQKGWRKAHPCDAREGLLGEYAPMCEFVGNIGQIAVAETEEDMRPLEARAADLRRMGWTHEELIDRQELRRLAPAVAEHCIGGLGPVLN